MSLITFCTSYSGHSVGTLYSLAWGQPEVLHVRQLPCLEQGFDTSSKDCHWATMKIPLTLTGLAAAANPGKHYLLCTMACTWDRHDKDIGKRNVRVKDTTYWRNKITLVSASIWDGKCNLGHCKSLFIFEGQLSFGKLQMKIKYLVELFLSIFPYCISLKKLNRSTQCPHTAPRCAILVQEPVRDKYHFLC